MALGQFSGASQLGPTAAWEVDLWGKFRHRVESADAAYLASIASYDDVLVSLIGDVAADYIAIRTARQQIAIAQRNVVKQKEALAIASDRFKGGATSELDVYQAQNVLAQTEAAIPQYTAQLQKQENALRVLLGEPPETIDSLLNHSRGIPSPPPTVAVRHAGGTAAPPAGRARGGAEGRGAKRAGRHGRGRSISRFQSRRRAWHRGQLDQRQQPEQAVHRAEHFLRLRAVVQLADPQLRPDHQ